MFYYFFNKSTLYTIKYFIFLQKYNYSFILNISFVLLPPKQAKIKKENMEKNERLIDNTFMTHDRLQ